MNMNSIYYHRLQNALESGLYAQALSVERMFHEAFPSRSFQNVSLSEIDEVGLLAHTSLLIALRQDARAANISDRILNSKLQIAGAVGAGPGDWPLTLTLAGYNSRAQKDDRFLATAYPAVYVDDFKRAANANSVRPELLYSVVREESRFFPAAVSSHGAMGLFQILPSTFKAQLKKYKSLDLEGELSKEAFLLNPGLAIEFGGFWFGRILRDSQKENLLLRIMEHHAGYGAVKTWHAGWKAMGRDDDVEYMVETARYLSTRSFARRVLRNMIIADASGMFAD